MLFLLSLLLHCLVVDVAALQFVGPSTLVYSLTSNNFWLNFIFLLFWIFCLQQFPCIHPPPKILPAVSVEVWRTLLLGIPYFYTWNATKVARYIYCYKWFFIQTVYMCLAVGVQPWVTSQLFEWSWCTYHPPYSLY